MDKETFLSGLREALAGEIPDYQIEEHIRYYREYLSNETDGKTEEEKLAELGAPRLIAKTILAAAEIRTESLHQGSQDSDYSQYEDAEQNAGGGAFRAHIFRWDDLAWYQKMLAVFVGAAIIVVLGGILILGVKIFFSFILPILLIVFVVQMVVMLLRR